MPLTKDEVRHIAELARLGLSETEAELYCDQLGAILEYAARLQQVDTSAIPPTSTVLPVLNVMRDDLVAPSMLQEDVLANAPVTQDGCFRVQAVPGADE